MMHRRELIAGTLVAGAVLASPASACRAPAAKDRAGYTRVIDGVFSAWWGRDFTRFQQAFQHPERTGRLNLHRLFEAHFQRPERRFRGDMLFNGEAVMVQVVTPKEADAYHGICGGYASADLFLVRFFPGLDTPVVDQMHYIDTALLADSEWNGTVRQQT
jgi:hypothetical protein